MCYLLCIFNRLTSILVCCQKSVIHHHLNVRSNLDLHKGIARINNHADAHVGQQEDKAKRSLLQNNLSSRSPTKDHIIVRSQSIADQNFDERKNLKVAKVNDKWFCWNFDAKLNQKDNTFPWNALPRFRRVYELSIMKENDLHFVNCSCGYYHRIGIPCSHVFKITNCMRLSMFHVRHYKLYDAYYTSKGAMGEMLKKAQVSITLGIHVHET